MYSLYIIQEFLCFRNNNLENLLNLWYYNSYKTYMYWKWENENFDKGQIRSQNAGRFGGA